MAQHPGEGENAKNYELFRDALSAVLIEKLSRPTTPPRPKRSSRRKPTAKPVPPTATQTAPDVAAVKPEASPDPEPSDADDLADFIDYIASETFPALPPDVQSLAHHTWAANPSQQSAYSGPFTGAAAAALLPALSPSVPDSLAAYGITSDAQGPHELLAPVLGSYIAAASPPPPPPMSTKAAAAAAGCELCGRDWINLSYHHLIPRFVHAKVVKRGWHRADELQNVAWLCGACHRAVHRFANHEDLARKYYTVELLLQQDEIVRFADWVGRLRWKKK